MSCTERVCMYVHHSCMCRHWEQLRQSEITSFYSSSNLSVLLLSLLSKFPYLEHVLYFATHYTLFHNVHSMARNFHQENAWQITHQIMTFVGLFSWPTSVSLSVFTAPQVNTGHSAGLSSLHWQNSSTFDVRSNVFRWPQTKLSMVNTLPLSELL